MSDAEQKKEEFWATLMADTNQKNARWAASLGLNPEAEVDPADAGTPDFDAGARESAPVPSNPSRDHNDLVIALIARTNGQL